MSSFGRSPWLAVWVVGLVSLLAHGGPPERQGAVPPAGQGHAHVDRHGDPLPEGARFRLGTVRFRHPGWAKRVFFLPGDKSVVSRAETNSLRFWEADTGRLLGEITSDQPFLFQAVALSPDGKQIYSAGRSREADDQNFRGTLRVWDAATRKQVKSVDWPMQFEPSGLAFTPDRKTLFTKRGGNVQVWEVETGTELLDLRLSERELRGLAVSPDGKLVATSEDRGILYLWEWQSDRPPREIKVGEREASALAFSPDGKLLAGSVGWPSQVHVWDVTSGKRRQRLTVPGSEHYSHFAVAFSPDGKTLAAAGRTGGSFRGAVHFWGLPAGKYRDRLDLGGDSAYFLAFSADGRKVAVGAGSGVRVWDLAAGKELARHEEAHHGTITEIAVSPQGVLATASDDHTVRLWDLATGRQQHKLEHDNWVRAVAFSPDGKLAVSSGLDDTVRLWDARTGRQIYKLFGHGETGGKRTLAFLPDGKRFLSFGDDFYLRVWDVKTGKALVEHAIRPSGLRFPEGEEDETARWERLSMSLGKSAFSPDGKLFVLNVGQFHVFDVATGKEVRKVPNEGSHVLSMAVSPDGKLLLASAWGKSVATKLPDGRTRYSSAKHHPLCLWELATGKLLKKIDLPEGGAGPVAFSPDGKVFAAATRKPRPRVRFWEVESGKELKSLVGQRGRATALAFSPDGKRLLSAMEDTSVLVWDLTNRD